MTEAEVVITDPPYQSLLRRPGPFEDESILGYLLRVTEANGYGNLYWITELAGLSRSFVTAPEPLDRLASLLRVNVSVLSRMCYRPKARGGRYVWFGKAAVPRQTLQISHPRYCPSCLGEAAYFPAAWDLRPVTVCHDHETPLLGHCRSCGHRLSWRASHLTQCSRCGFSLKDADPGPKRPEAAWLARLFLTKAGMYNGPPGPQPVTAAIDRLTLRDVARFAIFVGHQAAGLRGDNGMRGWGSRDEGRMLDVMCGAGTVLCGWPTAFWDLLDVIRARNGDNTGTSLEKQFKPLYPALFNKFPGKRFAFARAEFEAYVQNRWGDGVTTRRNKHVNKRRSDQPATQKEAANLLRVRLETVRSLVDEGHLVGKVRRAGSRRMLLIDRQSLQSFITETGELLDLAAAAAMLGVGKTSLKELVRQGILEHFPVILVYIRRR